MLVKDFITKEIPVLKSFDTVEYALSLMDDCKVRHLPLLKGSIYHCLISDKELLSATDPKEAIGETVLFAPAVKENSHLHKVLALMTRYGLSVLPVINVGGEYLGVITQQKVIDAFAELCNAEAAGSIIVLELLPQDYSLSEIARIVESNNAHILNLFSILDKDTGRLQMTIKINLEDASPVIRSFERFNYTIVYHFMKTGMVDDVLQKRMNELLHYMNM
jgi:CBS domain-containing protein